jgi:hypothetical protein
VSPTIVQAYTVAKWFFAVAGQDGRHVGEKRAATVVSCSCKAPVQFLSSSLGEEVLEVYELRVQASVRRPDTWLPYVGLGVPIWEGHICGTARHMAGVV